MPEPLDIYYSTASAGRRMLQALPILAFSLVMLYVKGKQYGWPMWIYPAALLLVPLLWGGRMIYERRRAEPLLRIDEQGVTDLRKQYTIAWSHIKDVWLGRWEEGRIEFDAMAFSLSEVQPYAKYIGLGVPRILKRLDADFIVRLYAVDRPPDEIVARAQQWLYAMRPELRESNG